MQLARGRPPVAQAEVALDAGANDEPEMKGLLEEGRRRGAARGDRREGVEGDCALLDDQVNVNAARALGAIVQLGAAAVEVRRQLEERACSTLQ